MLCLRFRIRIHCGYIVTSTIFNNHKLCSWRQLRSREICSARGSGPDRCCVFESASASNAVSSPFQQFPTIAGFVIDVNSDRIKYCLAIPRVRTIVSISKSHSSIFFVGDAIPRESKISPYTVLQRSLYSFPIELRLFLSSGRLRIPSDKPFQGAMGLYLGRSLRPTHLVLNPASNALEEGLSIHET